MLNSGTSAYLEPGSAAAARGRQRPRRHLRRVHRRRAIDSAGFDYVEPGGGDGTTSRRPAAAGSAAARSMSRAARPRAARCSTAAPRSIYGMTIGTVVNSGGVRIRLSGRHRERHDRQQRGREHLRRRASARSSTAAATISSMTAAPAARSSRAATSWSSSPPRATDTLVSGAGGGAVRLRQRGRHDIDQRRRAGRRGRRHRQRHRRRQRRLRIRRLGRHRGRGDDLGRHLELTAGAVDGRRGHLRRRAGGLLKLDASQAFRRARSRGSPSPTRSTSTTSRSARARRSAFQEAGGNQSGTLTVSSGSEIANLTLLGQYVAGQFNIATDGAGGTLVTDPPLSSGDAVAPVVAVTRYG